MMRRSVVLVAMLCAAGTVFAQAPPADMHGDWQAKRQQWEQKWRQKHAEMEQRRMDRLSVLLDMTPAQKQQVQAIFSAQHARMQQVMKQAMDAGRAAHAETMTKLGQVLSPAQMKKFKLLRPEHRHRFLMMRGRMGHMDMGGPMGKWHLHPDHDEGPPPPPPGP